MVAKPACTGEIWSPEGDCTGTITEGRPAVADVVTRDGGRVTSYEYDAANRLTSVDGVAYTWDANGNLLSDGVRSYSYDHADRLVRVVSGTSTTEFAYDGVGDRVAKTVNGVTTDYVLDPAAGLTQVLVERTGGQTTGYLYGHDLLAQYDSGTWAYHVSDGLGSVRQVAEIFAVLEPPGDVSVDEAVARMETMIRHAARLARQGQGDVASRACYALTSRCVDFCETYGAHDIFPLNLPYNFAVAYRDLALDQLEEHADAIEAKVRDILRGDWALEMLGIEAPLMEMWGALGL